MDQGHQLGGEHRRVAVDTLAGLRRDVEIGLVIAPTPAHASAAASSLAAFLGECAEVPVRLAGVASTGSRILITLAVTLGSVDDVKVASPQARSAVLLLQRLIDEFSSYDPSFVLLPDPESPEARLADHLSASRAPLNLAEAVRQLVPLG